MCLDATACLPGYSGTIECGMWQGHLPSVGSVDIQVHRVNVPLGQIDVEVDQLDQEQLQDTLNIILDFISNVR